MDGVTRTLRIGFVIALVLAVAAFVLPSLCGGAERGDEPKETKETEKPKGDAEGAGNGEGAEPDKDKPGDLWFDLRGEDGEALEAELKEMFKRIDELEKRMDELMGRQPQPPGVDRDWIFELRPRQQFQFQHRESLPAEIEELLKRLEKGWPNDIQRRLEEGDGAGPFRFNIEGPPEAFTFQLRMDVQETDDAYVYTLDVPGMAKDAITVEIENNVLTVSGERKERVEEKDAEGRETRREIVYGSFTRAITLPGNADTEKITSEYKDGVLTITVPKKEEQAEAESRRIIVHQP
jgi:HSP20 family protein